MPTSSTWQSFVQHKHELRCEVRASSSSMRKAFESPNIFHTTSFLILLSELRCQCKMWAEAATTYLSIESFCYIVEKKCIFFFFSLWKSCRVAEERVLQKTGLYVLKIALGTRAIVFDFLGLPTFQYLSQPAHTHLITQAKAGRLFIFRNIIAIQPMLVYNLNNYYQKRNAFSNSKTPAAAATICIFSCYDDK